MEGKDVRKKQVFCSEAESGAGGIAEGCGGQEASGVRTGDDRSGGNRAGGHQPQFFLQI